MSGNAKSAQDLDDTDTDASSTAGCLTPTTTVAESLQTLSLGSRAEAPCPGSLYIIEAISSRKLLTLERGNVCMTEGGSRSASIHWECVEDGFGWLGFRNPISGNYLGLKLERPIDKLACVANFHGDEQAWVVRARQDGSYKLQVLWSAISQGESWPAGVRKFLYNIKRIPNGIASDIGVMRPGNREGPEEFWKFYKVE